MIAKLVEQEIEQRTREDEDEDAEKKEATLNKIVCKTN